MAYIWLKYDHARTMLLEIILHQLIHQGVFPFAVNEMFHHGKPYLASILIRYFHKNKPHYPRINGGPLLQAESTIICRVLFRVRFRDFQMLSINNIPSHYIMGILRALNPPMPPKT